jgi:hypothetical protein
MDPHQDSRVAVTDEEQAHLLAAVTDEESARLLRGGGVAPGRRLVLPPNKEAAPGLAYPLHGHGDGDRASVLPHAHARMAAEE